MDCSLPGSSVHGILQAKIPEWVAIPFSRGSSWLRDHTGVSSITGGFFTFWATREGPNPLIRGESACKTRLQLVKRGRGHPQKLSILPGVWGRKRPGLLHFLTLDTGREHQDPEESQQAVYGSSDCNSRAPVIQRPKSCQYLPFPGTCPGWGYEGAGLFSKHPQGAARGGRIVKARSKTGRKDTELDLKASSNLTVGN